jgi:pimeloyl-ACP methyl ester carboxylesterase
MELEEAARRVRVPVLLVYGESDRIVPIEQGERMAGAIASAEFFRVPGGTHLSTPIEPVVVHQLATWIGRQE